MLFRAQGCENSKANFTMDWVSRALSSSYGSELCDVRHVSASLGFCLPSGKRRR